MQAENFMRMENQEFTIYATKITRILNHFQYIGSSTRTFFHKSNFSQCATAEPIRKMFYISLFGLSFFCWRMLTSSACQTEWQNNVFESQNRHTQQTQCMANGNSKIYVYVVHSRCVVFIN